MIYSAVFVLASVLTTRAIAFGLLYVLIWEGLLSNLVGGARILSIAHYCLGIANAIHPDPNLNAGLTLATSVILGAIVTVGALDPRHPPPVGLRHPGRARLAHPRRTPSSDATAFRHPHDWKRHIPHPAASLAIG